MKNTAYPRLRLASALLWLASCRPCYPNAMLGDVGPYVARSGVAVAGVSSIRVVNNSKTRIDGAQLERRLRAVAACIQSIRTDLLAGRIHEDMAWGCAVSPGALDGPLYPTCAAVIIVDPVAISEDGRWQLTSALAPASLCEAKGLHPKAGHPCRWRSYVQNNREIVTPPAVYLWDLVRLATTCNNIWSSPFAKCGLL